MDRVEIRFLRESNNIENEWDDLALEDAIFAWQYLRKQDDFRKDTILHTHKLLMENRDTISDSQKGQWRTNEVMIGGRLGAKSYLIPHLMEAWIKKTYDLIYGLERDLFTDKEIEQKIQIEHIEFEKIHPFADGNGRTGRMLLNWTRIQFGLPILVIKEREKEEYYKWF